MNTYGVLNNSSYSDSVLHAPGYPVMLLARKKRAAINYSKFKEIEICYFLNVASHYAFSLYYVAPENHILVDRIRVYRYGFFPALRWKETNRGHCDPTPVSLFTISSNPAAGQSLRISIHDAEYHTC